MPALILDTDGASDDAAALLMAARSPDLVAVTVTGGVVPLDQAVADSGNGTGPSGGTTGVVPAGELAIAGLITGGQPGTISPGASQKVPYVIDVQNGSASADLEDILSTAAGTQTASDALGSGSDWYMVVATFRPG